MLLKTCLTIFLVCAMLNSPFAFGNQCKSAIAAFERAKDAENKACNAASKAWKDKSLDEYKNADRRCKENRKKSEKANKKMRENC